VGEGGRGVEKGEEICLSYGRGYWRARVGQMEGVAEEGSAEGDAVDGQESGETVDGADEMAK